VSNASFFSRPQWIWPSSNGADDDSPSGPPWWEDFISTLAIVVFALLYLRWGYEMLAPIVHAIGF
jgi:hypothetical protein